jgi:hypothetical protein
MKRAYSILNGDSNKAISIAVDNGREILLSIPGAITPAMNID